MTNSFKAAVVQSAPVFMDLEGCLDKACGLIERAAADGAKLIAFPELWFPGYPWWIWLAAPAQNVRYFQRYHENSLTLGDDAFKRLGETARKNGIYISAGASERDYGSLYIAQFLFDDHGELLQARRKLKPTHVERTVFGEGDGSHLKVFETEIGRLGQLSCWEHLQPLARYAMYSMHEQVHVAAWPTFSLYPQAYALTPQANHAVTQAYAMEGQCFVLAASGVISPEMHEMLVETDEQAEMLKVGGGFAQVYAPDGRPLCDPLDPGEDGLLFAELDLGAIAVAKSFADPVGHYSRPDVTRLLLNRRPQRRVEEFTTESFEELPNVSEHVDGNHEE